MDTADLLAPLIEMGKEAGARAIAARAKIQKEIKPDGSIVTNADRLVEEYLRQELANLTPDAAIWGEEFGFSAEREGGLWLVDPIDGTSNYAFGSPLWGVSIAYLKNGELLLGLVDLPELRETYWCARRQGVYRNGQKLDPIPSGAIQDIDLVSYNDRILGGYSRLPGKMRHAGAFVIDGAFVASQRYRGLVGYRERLYDIAACVLFGQELGADVRYADGASFDIGELSANVKVAKPWIIFPRESGFNLGREPRLI